MMQTMYPNRESFGQALKAAKGNSLDFIVFTTVRTSNMLDGIVLKHVPKKHFKRSSRR